KPAGSDAYSLASASAIMAFAFGCARKPSPFTGMLPAIRTSNTPIRPRGTTRMATPPHPRSHGTQLCRLSDNGAIVVPDSAAHHYTREFGGNIQSGVWRSDRRAAGRYGRRPSALNPQRATSVEI